MNRRIYLDHNAGTPIHPLVLEAVTRELFNEYGNPSSSHYDGQQSRLFLESQRELIANHLKVKPQEILFNSGGTEGANFLIHGILSRFKTGHIITSPIEHASVFQVVQRYEKLGFSVSYLDPGLWGAVDPQAVEQAINAETKLIVLMAVNNETGVKTDWESIAEIAQRHSIPFVVDGVALLGKEQFTIPLGVSGMFFSGHKIQAPKGVGFCFCRRGIKIEPMFFGGSQEFNKRGGTENLSGIAGLGAAIKIIFQDQPALTNHFKAMRDLLEKGLKEQLEVVLNGLGPRIGNTSNLSFPGIDGETLLMRLDMAGISVSHGSACSSGALEPSRVLLGMGVPLKLARSAIRFSVGRDTTEADIKQVIDVIVRLHRS